jgi:2'-5' RNA ligase
MRQTHASTGYSIWLMPTGNVRDELSKTISQLSHQYATPVFPPHVTLIGNLLGGEKELSSQTQQLAARIRAFEISLTTIDFLDEYFRCLFLRAAETPPLLEAHQMARALFHREQEPRFMPHLSLLYGHFDAETKQQIIQAIGRGFRKTFSATALHLFSTTGEPKDWYRVQEFEMP